MMDRQEYPLWIGCVADDFTGGSDAASFLRKAGLNTVLINGEALDGPLPPFRAEAVVIALKSRTIPAAEAVSQTLRAAGWLLERGAKQLYFKYCSTFDSTPQGNIGPVTDALLELLGERYTVLCPALPVNGRVVRNGILYVNGVPLAESSMKDHPLTPMRRSDLTELMMEQSIYPCIALTREQLSLPSPAEACGIQGRFTLVPTYETGEDGKQIAKSFGELRLLTGGSGLLFHLGRRYSREEGGAGSDLELKAEAPRLLLAGSCSAMTQKQVRRYLEQGERALQIRPDLLLSGSQTEEALCQAITEAREAGRDILLYSTADAEQRGPGPGAATEGIPELLETLMGRLAVHGQACGFQRIMVAGGETSGAVVRALGAKAYHIGQDAAPGVPVLWPVDGQGLCLVLKSGNFGNEDFFLTVLKPDPKTD